VVQADRGEHRGLVSAQSRRRIHFSDSAWSPPDLHDIKDSTPSFGAYVIRWLLRPIDILITTGFVGFVSIIVTQHGQRVGDVAARTTVVRQQKETETPGPGLSGNT